MEERNKRIKMDRFKNKDSGAKPQVSATELYIKIIKKQIEYCDNNFPKYGILYDKGFKDGLRKAIKIIKTIKEEVNKHEESEINNN